MDHVVRACLPLHAKKIIAVVGHQAEQVSAAVETLDVEAVLQQPQNGTGHALLVAKRAISNAKYVIVLPGDAPLIRTETLRAFEKMGFGAKTGEGAENDFGFEARGVDDTVGLDEDGVAKRGVAEDASGADGAAGADFCFAEELDGGLEDGVFTDSDVGIDEDGFRKLDGDAVAHELIAFPFAEGAVDAGEIGAGVAAESFARVGGDFGEDGFAAGVEEGDGVGEIDFAVFVVGFYVGERGPEFGGGEAIDAGINFVEFALIGSELGFLDDGGDGVAGFTEDAAVARGIGEDGGEDSGGGVAGFVFLEKGAKSFRANERGVTGKNDDVLGVADGAFRNE